MKTRKAHLVTVSLTACSWFILGIRYGWGYCLCTDWHWQVREALGRPIMSDSYIHFLVRELTGIDLPPDHVDTAVLGVFAACAAVSLGLNARDMLRSRKRKRDSGRRRDRGRGGPAI